MTAARAVLAAAAAATLVGTVLAPGLRDADGSLATLACFPLAVAAALAALAATLGTRWRRPGAWLALALAGQGAALQLIGAGPVVGYQHYRPFAELQRLPWLAFLGLVVVQALVVGIGIGRRWPAVRRHAGALFGTWSGLLAAGFFLGTSASPSASLVVYAGELLLATAAQLVFLGNAILIGAAAAPLEPGPRVASLLDWFMAPRAAGRDHREGRPWAARAGTEDAGGPGRGTEDAGSPGRGTEDAGSLRPDRFTVAAAVWVLVAAAVLNVVAYERLPHVPDEVIYWFQARYMAAGELALPAPPVPEAFDQYHIPVEDGRWYGTVPPGWPMILSVGFFLGAPWLVSPVLGALALLGIAMILQHLYDRRIARLGTVLLATSPWFLFVSMSFMTHAATLGCAVGATVAVIMARRSGRALWNVVAGVPVGLVFLTRPLEGVIVAVLLGLWCIGFGGRRLPLAAVAALVLSTAAVSALVLPYNAYFTGEPTRFPINEYLDREYWPKVNALGFGPERGQGWPSVDPFPGHTPRDAALNAVLNLHAVNFELFGWPTGSVALLLVALLAGTGRGAGGRPGSRRRPDRLMIALVLAVVGALSLYWYSGGHDYGARYWYLTLPALVALGARGIETLVERWGEGSGGSEGPAPGVTVGAARPAAQGGVTLGVLATVAALCCMTVVNYLPWRAIDKYHDYRGLQGDVAALAREQGFGRSLILVRGDRFPDYASAFVRNPMELTGDRPIYVWDRDADVRRRVVAAFPDRPVWVVDGPTLTGGRYVVRQGPLPPGTVPEAEPAGGVPDPRPAGDMPDAVPRRDGPGLPATGDGPAATGSGETPPASGGLPGVSSSGGPTGS